MPEAERAGSIQYQVEGDWFIVRLGDEVLRARYADSKKFEWEANGRETAAEAWLARYRSLEPNYATAGVKALAAAREAADKTGARRAAAAGLMIEIELGAVAAIPLLGRRLLDGSLGWTDPEGAFQLYKRGAELNDVDSLVACAVCYGDGIGVERDDARSLSLLDRAATLGELTPFLSVIMESFYTPRSIPQWLELSKRWIEIATPQVGKEVRYVNRETGYIDKLAEGATKEEENAYNLRGLAFQVGLRYRNGDGVNRDDAEAFKYFKISAEHGHPVGLYEAAVCAYEGAGTPMDRELARDYFRQSAELGFREGTRAYGHLLTESPEAGADDLAEGVRWLRLAALRSVGPEKQMIERYIKSLGARIDLKAIHGDPKGWRGDFHADDYRPAGFGKKLLKYFIWFVVLLAIALTITIALLRFAETYQPTSTTDAPPISGEYVP